MPMEGQTSNKSKEHSRIITFKKLSFVVLILSPQFDLRILYLSVLVFVSEVCQHLYLSCPIELAKPCGHWTGDIRQASVQKWAKSWRKRPPTENLERKDAVFLQIDLFFNFLAFIVCPITKPKINSEMP